MTWTRGKQAQLEDAAREFMHKAQALGVNVSEIELIPKGSDAGSVSKAAEIERLEKLADSIGERDLAQAYRDRARKLREERD